MPPGNDCTPDLRYDALIAGMPLAFAATYLVSAQFTAATLPAVAAASLACCLLIADGLYRNPPTLEE